jgi:hypothetical protein
LKITITKKEQRNQLTCWRADGSCEIADLGPSLPHHDLAHFVVERELKMVEGFFGRIARGFTVAHISEKETILNSPPESFAAEVAARALQSLSSGACRNDQFAELVNTELSKWRVPAIAVSSAQTASMLAQYQELTKQYEILRVGETMQLEFPFQRYSRNG